MKKLATAIALATLIATPALAADMGRKMPVKAPPPAPAPAYSWTGWYVGLNGGYGWSKQTDQITAVTDPFFILRAVPTSVSIRANGFIGGAQAGYNWQISPTWLAGLEADFSGANISGSNTLVGTGPFPRTMTAAERLEWLGTVRGRLGLLPADRLLLYVTGGLAYGETKLSTSVGRAILGCAGNNCEAGSVSDTKTGWTIGGGVEWAFALNWSLRAEYLYVDLGSLSHNMIDPNFPGEIFNASIPVKVNIVRAGLNYKFTSW